MSNEWVMVPREPTEAIFSASRLQEWDTFEQEWRAMLDAAPAAPQQAEPAPTKRWWTDADELLLDSARDILIKSSIRVAGNEDAILRLMKSAPAMTGAQMEAATVSDEASQERAAIAYKRGYDEALNDCIRNGGEAWARSMFADQGEHIKPQEQAEPVAWAVFDPSGEVVYAALYKIRCVEYADNEYRYGHSAAKNWVVRPVFAHPPAAEVQRLRDALEDLLHHAETHRAEQVWVLRASEVADIARRALEGK